MLGRIVGGAALGAVLLFLIGFVWWGLAGGPGSAAMHSAPDELAFRNALTAELPASGVYVVPNMEGDSPEELETWQARHREGPIALVVFEREGRDPMGPSSLALGFLHGFVSCLLAAVAVARLGAGRGFLGRWGIVLLLGLFVALYVNVGGMVWWYQPTDLVAAQGSYNFVGLALAGLPIAWLVRRK